MEILLQIITFFALLWLGVLISFLFYSIISIFWMFILNALPEYHLDYKPPLLGKILLSGSFWQILSEVVLYSYFFCYVFHLSLTPVFKTITIGVYIYYGIFILIEGLLTRNDEGAGDFQEEDVEDLEMEEHRFSASLGPLNFAGATRKSKNPTPKQKTKTTVLDIIKFIFSPIISFYTNFLLLINEIKEKETKI